MKIKISIFFIVLIGPIAGIAQTKSLSYFVDSSLKNNPQLYEYRNLILSNSIDSQLIVAANKF
ncbi:MAG: hypothetical protein ACRDE8_11735 [Ginsengibacter sp.]